MKFGKDFLLGAATAAHQVEGNNTKCDFWTLENMPNTMYKEPSLDAVDHYNRYEEDIKLLAGAGLNAYRYSIEWARIQPDKDTFDENEIEHYRKVLICCHENGVTPIVTLHHFSSPKWLITEGGWEDEKTVEYFGRYTEHVISELGDLIPYVCTINEANMGLQIGKVAKRQMERMARQAKANEANHAEVQVGLNTSMQSKMADYFRSMDEAFGTEVSPGSMPVFLAPRTIESEIVTLKCHEKAREVIRKLHPEIKVGITFSLYDHQALPGGKTSVEKELYEDFLHYLPYIKDDDFFGVQNYTRKVHDETGVISPDDNTRLTKAGYEYYPEALGGVLRYVSKHLEKPLLVTENGISTADDTERVEFIDRALKGVADCIAEGIPVIGYCHWSLLDNFEWQLGYDQTFGLIAVDRSTQTRYPKASLKHLGSYHY